MLADIRICQNVFEYILNIILSFMLENVESG